MAYYTYILCSKRNGTLYTGSTNSLLRRVWEHKHPIHPSFSSKYGVNQLVYYEIHDTYGQAAQREKRIKAWPRKWKLNLIEKDNPEWRDLFNEL